MAYFPDLTPYAYGREKPQPDILNIGWLGPEEEFPTGYAQNLADKLVLLIREAVNLYRGWHTCHVCSKAKGNGEIRIKAADGKTYVAPYMIAHYVMEHGYLPPDEFITAVMEAP